MARMCKCQVTHEIGDTDTFIKIDGKYYKSQQVYDDYKSNAKLHKQIIDIIVNDFLDYEKDQVFPTILTKKLKELDFYPNDVILQTIKADYDNIKYWMNTKNFNSEVGKISYIFAIIKGNINDIYKEWKRNEAIKVKEKTPVIDVNINFEDLNTIQKGKDISGWLEEDEWN